MNKEKLSFEKWRKCVNKLVKREVLDTPKTPLKFWYDNGLSIKSVVDLINGK